MTKLFRTLLALLATWLLVLPLAAQTVSTTGLTRTDTLASGSARFGYPTTFDSSQVRMYWCLRTASSGTISKWKCSYRTDAAWLPRVTPPPSPVTLTAVVVTPGSVNLLTGATQQFNATGTFSDATSATLAVGWSATGGTVTSGGLYTAGGTPGTYRVIGTHAGSGLADTSAIVLAATLSNVVLTPASVSLLTGAQQQFTATGLYSDGSTGVLPIAWTSTGGTVTSAGLYTAGGSAGSFRVIATHAATGKADTSAITLTVPAATLSSVVLTPSSASLLSGSSQQFTAVGLMSDASTTTIPITWTATGGTISSTGLYTAGATAGTIYRVIAVHAATGKADTSGISISVPAPPAPGGPYVALYAKDWNSYADKAALAGVIGVEGGLQTAPPSLPVTAFYDLVSDPIFGKVARYLGDTTLNINATSTTRPGRTASHSIGLGKKSQINASWWTPTCTMSPTACNVDWFPTDVWAHQFLRFSTTWTSASATCGQGAADYKTIFLRYWSSAARDELKFGTNGRGIIVSKGLPGLTMVSEGALSNQNAIPMSVQYPGSSGWPGYDGWPLTSAPGPFPSAPYGSGSNYGAGNGQWIEVAIHHKSVAERLEFSVYWRQYTVGGVVDPQPWKIDGHYTQVTTGQVWRGLSNYVMGVNRNRCYDFAMSIDWGPYEVVDGSVYPNPWGLVLP